MQLAAYYYPNFHPDCRHHDLHGAGWSEWQLVQAARPRFPGHRQPLQPLWGFQNEALPEVMLQKAGCAWAHGLKAFIFDWYFYEDGPFLEQPLEQAFLPQMDGTKLCFALMWANHNWNDIHPWEYGTPLRMIHPARLSDAAFGRLCDYVIDRYLSHPAYWRLNGKAYFSVYNLPMLQDIKRLELMKKRAERAGFPLHLNVIIPKNPILPDELGLRDFSAFLQAGFVDSCTLYVWNSHVAMDTFPVFSYACAREQIRAVNQNLLEACSIPFFPNVTVGWDCSPRADQKSAYLNHGYPYCPVMISTPEEFGNALREAGESLPEVITINAWNEWTEGSYLEPDQEYGYARLQQVRNFVEARQPARFSNVCEGEQMAGRS